MKRAALLTFAAALLLTPTVPAYAGRTKGVTKICPGYTVPIAYKKPCPPPPPETPPPPTPDPIPVVEAHGTTIGEANGPMNVIVTKTGTSSTATTVNYATANGTAIAGTDYTAKSGTLTFAAGGSSQQTVQVPITNNILDDGDRTFTFGLSGGTNNTVANNPRTLTIVDDDDAPPVNPPVATGNEATESLEGYTWRTVTDHNYLNDLQTEVVNTRDAGIDPLGAFRLICGSGVAGYYDHVVYPGEDGKSHYHRFNGNNSVTANSSFGSLLNAGSSTCQSYSGATTASQRSVYWFPALLRADGKEIDFDFNSVYYKRIPKSNPNCGTPTGTGFGPVGICIEIPNGLKLVTGSKMVAGQYGPAGYTSQVVPPVHFQCSAGGSGDYRDLAKLTAGAPSCTQVAMIAEFPDCWDGLYLWKTDRSHLAYKTNMNTDGKLRCPTTHPYYITTLTIHYYFTIAPGELSGLYLASDYMDPTQPRGWSIHSDGHIVWDARVKRMFHDNCIERHLNCDGGDLGGGYRLKGAGQPIYGFTNPNRVKSVPPMPANMVMP